MKKFVTKYWVGITVLVLGVAYLTFRLGAGALWDFDEANYAAIARNIVRSGDWITLRWTDAPWFQKPPLFFWLTAISFKILGFTETAARLVSALSASLTALIVYFWTLRLTKRRIWGVLSAGILLASQSPLRSDRFCNEKNFRYHPLL